MRSELKGLSPLYSPSGGIGLTGLKKMTRSLQAYLSTPSPQMQLDRKKSVNKEKRYQGNKFTDNME